MTGYKHRLRHLDINQFAVVLPGTNILTRGYNTQKVYVALRYDDRMVTYIQNLQIWKFAKHQAGKIKAE